VVVGNIRVGGEGVFVFVRPLLGWGGWIGWSHHYRSELVAVMVFGEQVAGAFL